MQLQFMMPQKSRNNVFRKKYTTNKAPSRIFRSFAVPKKVRVVFPNQRIKPKEHFQPLKTNNKVCFLYLQCKLTQDRRS